MNGLRLAMGGCRAGARGPARCGWLSRLAAFAVVAACGAVAGCATTAAPSPSPQSPSSQAPLLRLSPASLGRSLALQQQLTVTAVGGEQLFDLLLEADAERLQLALLRFGQTAARLAWDGSRLDEWHAPGWPAALRGERILSELQLVLWPAAAIRAALPAGWTLDDGGGRRVLRHDGEAVIAVDHPVPDAAVLVHLRDGYRLRIRSRPASAAEGG